MEKIEVVVAHDDRATLHVGDVWSLRCLLVVRWLAEHGYGSPEEFPEVAVLRSRT